jgi:protein-S-isoprenylcysteine O-methyltransferase Ste14
VNRTLLALYPRAWRERYGTEVADLADELVEAGDTTRARAAFDLVGGAAAEWWRVVTGPAVLPVTCVGVAAAAATCVAGYLPALLLVSAEVVWLLMELAELRRGRRAGRRGDKGPQRGQRRLWLAVGGCAVGQTVIVNLAPTLAPGARIGSGDTVFLAGLALLAAGLGLRGWSFAALRGRYLNFSVAVRTDHPVLTAGPYRLLRHPGNAGILLICTGIGLASANWVGLAAMTVAPLAIVVWRIRAEERALLGALGEAYRRYAADHKRLVPLVW